MAAQRFQVPGICATPAKGWYKASARVIASCHQLSPRLVEQSSQPWNIPWQQCRGSFAGEGNKGVSAEPSKGHVLVKGSDAEPELVARRTRKLEERAAIAHDTPWNRARPGGDAFWSALG